MSEFIDAICRIFEYWPTYERPRRVFSRRFVVFCILVAIVELIILNALFG